MSQEYVASELGVSQKAYSKLETSQTKIDWDKITSVAKIFSIDALDIVSFDDNLVFNNYSRAGKAQTFNKIPNEFIDMYEKRIEELKEEVIFLRSQLMR
jgi:transcriptional regulator with XRE-family HTH domain